MLGGQDKIYSMDLLYEGAPMPFVIKTMEEIDDQLGGIADTPHRHNYYTIIWPVEATGKHIIDFREYLILPNHLFFVSPEQVHQIITDPAPTGFVILFTPNSSKRTVSAKISSRTSDCFATATKPRPLRSMTP